MKKIHNHKPQTVRSLQKLAETELTRVEGGVCETASGCYPADPNETGG